MFPCVIFAKWFTPGNLTKNRCQSRRLKIGLKIKKNRKPISGPFLERPLIFTWTRPIWTRLTFVFDQSPSGVTDNFRSMQCPIPSPHYYFVFCVKAKAIPRTISNNFAQFGFLSFSKCKSKTKLSIARHRANEIVLSSPAAHSIRALCFLVTVSRAAHLAAELWVSLARPVPPTFHFFPLK